MSESSNHKLLKYKRILLKLSGEALGNEGLEEKQLQSFASQLLEISQTGISLAVVIGGGNWLRGRENKFLNRVVADQLGMYATAMNGLALCSEINRLGGRAQTMSAQSFSGCEMWDYTKADQLLNSDCILVFVGGTGNPFFSTDSAAALRAIQINANALLKATKFNGVYDKDPALNKDAVAYDKISFNEVIEKRLSVMDLTAFDLCAQQNMPIHIFDLAIKNAITDIAEGKLIGTLIS